MGDAGDDHPLRSGRTWSGWCSQWRSVGSMSDIRAIPAGIHSEKIGVLNQPGPGQTSGLAHLHGLVDNVHSNGDPASEGNRPVRTISMLDLLSFICSVGRSLADEGRAPQG
jgi:hypothetical protein